VNATEVHSFIANGPFVAHDRLSCNTTDVTDKNSKQRRKVRGRRLHSEGRKIIREEFLPRAD
jgi:hypothetical protein